MPRITHRLTAIKVANVRDRGLHPDGGGLYLRVTAAGTKSWIFRFTRDGRTHDMGLGPVASVSLAKARELAAEGRRQHLGRVDPIKARAAERAAARPAEGATFKECAQQLIAARELGWRNAKHRLQWRSTLAAYAYPILGDVPVAEVTTDLVMQVLEPIWAKKSETASRVRSRTEAVLDWAKARGLRDGENAARWRGHLDHLLAPRSKVQRVRHYPALPYADMPTFIADLRTMTDIRARTLEFTILTAARTSEARHARWDEIHSEQRTWIVPADRMKSGREHRVPLSSGANAILAEMLQIRQNEYVFPGMKQGRPLADKALLLLVRALRPGFTVHGFRSTFKDWCAECTSFPTFVSEAALAHVVADKVEAAYRRTDLLEKRRKLMEAWASYCERTSAEVVPMKRRG